VKELATKALERVVLFAGRRMWGVGAIILPEIVRQFGPVGGVRWFVRNLPPYERAIKEIGGERTNLICCAASLFNGCAYCTHACARAFQLYYFDRSGKLFPLDDHQIISLIELPDTEALDKLDGALKEAGLDEEVTLIRRLYEIKLEGSEPKSDDAFLVHAIHMFDDLNFCSIDGQLGADEAHDRINRDIGLQQRYAAARLGKGHDVG
jgi:hypothetical protein